MTQQTMMKQQTNNTNNQQHQQYHNNNETNNNETTAFLFLFSLENLEQQNSLGVVFSWVLLVYYGNLAFRKQDSLNLGFVQNSCRRYIHNSM